jgi:hypothetical protein
VLRLSASPTRSSASCASRRARAGSAVFWKAPTITFSSTVIWVKGLSFWKVRATPSRLI